MRATFSTTKVQSYFSLKSRCSTLFTANVVYLFSCPCDKSVSYLGETRRQLFRRILEHGKMGTNSAVFEHLEGCDACQDKNIAESFTILQRCGSANICSVEAMFINKLRPSLNTQLGPSKGAARQRYRFLSTSDVICVIIAYCVWSLSMFATFFFSFMPVFPHHVTPSIGVYLR